MPTGFILQSTYRILSGRPVVHLYGRLDGGRPFLVRDTRARPRFWIPAADVERARALGAVPATGGPPRRSMAGEPLSALEVAVPGDVPPLRQRLVEAGIECFEADVRFTDRYLIDHGIRGSLEIDGPAVGEPGVGSVFEDPELRPADWLPRLSVLSLDIETDPQARRLLSVGLWGRGAAEVLLLTPPGCDVPAGAVACPTEKALLERLVARVAELDPDVLTGWNVIDFDLAVLARIASREGVRLALGRGAEPLRLRPSSSGGSPWARSRALVPGRLVLDGIDLLRGAFVRLDSYSLEGAAREILGRGKTITGHDRAAAILAAFEQDRAHLVEYNLNDARLVLEILDELRLIDLAVRRSRLTGMPPDRVGASIASFDYLYLSALAARGIAAPSVRPGAAEEPSSGGHVLEPAPGLYRNVLVLDFRSLYPSVIRTFQIDPLGLVTGPRDGEDLIEAPNGAAFRRERGILPAMLDELFPRREAAKRAGDAVASQAIKILMNSFYGVLGTSACRFASPALANAITGFGREVLLWTKARVEALGQRVLYGDTDSLFVLTGEERDADARALGERLVAELNAALAAHVERTWKVESRLELEFETLYLRLLLPVTRGGTAGARKRYAGLVERDGERRVVFTGLEAVRRDWTALAKRVQRELYRRLFDDLPVDRYLRDVVAKLRAGELDDELVYRKALRKKLSAYTASTPPHVAAARKLRGRPPRVIRYVVTRDGPEPAAERRAPLDHEHYVQKQVRAVAEPVLTVLGLDFDESIGDARQGRLF
jgi:DNA polymerase-2